MRKRTFQWKGARMLAELKNENLKNVLRIIARHKSLPFLELVNESDLDEQRLRDAVEQLERLRLIEVFERENIVKEYVRLRETAAAMGA